MTGAILVGIIALVVIGVVFARAMAARADGRSIERHERLLGTLGGVARKSDASAPVFTPAKKDLARPHVRVAADDTVEAAPAMIRPEVPPRIRLEPLELSGSGSLPVFDEIEALSGSGRTPVVHSSIRHRRRRKFASSMTRTDSDIGAAGQKDESDPGTPLLPAGDPERLVANLARKSAVPSARALVVGLVAVVLVGAVGTLAWDLGSKHPNHHAALRAPAVHAPQSRTVLATPPPTTVEPTAVSHTLVEFSAPKGGYTFTFTADGPCWIGIERVVNGPYEWMKTLDRGVLATFHTQGPAVVRIGAPRALTMQLNGVRVALPASNVNPFDATFS